MRFNVACSPRFHHKSSVQSFKVAILWCLAIPLGTACASPPPTQDGVFPVPVEASEFFRLRYRDGQLSSSETCMVRSANRLNPRIPPAYVNGRPMGFC